MNKNKIVFTNGCFDLLHPGHINLFKIGKSLGDILVVGLDMDDKIRKDKGPDRPINCFEDRKCILESIKYIDVVVGFNSQVELENLIKLYQPDILIDGGDWRKTNGVGRRFAKEVRFYDRTGGFSSTSIIERAKRSGKG